MFLAIAIIYWLFPYLVGRGIDYAGVTMLIALGAAMSLMAYVLFAGLRQPELTPQPMIETALVPTIEFDPASSSVPDWGELVGCIPLALAVLDRPRS